MKKQIFKITFYGYISAILLLMISAVDILISLLNNQKMTLVSQVSAIVSLSTIVTIYYAVFNRTLRCRVCKNFIDIAKSECPICENKQTVLDY